MGLYPALKASPITKLSHGFRASTANMDATVAILLSFG